MKYLICILLLASCSASWHLQKAKKKGAKFQQEIVYKYITEVDTVTNEVIIVDSVPYETIKIEYIPKTRIELKFDHKKFKDSLRFERMRLSSDLKRFKDSLRFASRITISDNKTLVKTAKIEKRTSRWWLWLLIGFCLNYIYKLAVKYFKP